MGFFDLFKRAKKEDKAKQEKSGKKKTDDKTSVPACFAESGQAASSGGQVDPRTGRIVGGGQKEKTTPTSNKKITRHTGNAYQILLKPIISEKASDLNYLGKYFFVVACRANKGQIKKAVEEVYDTKVKNVRTINFSGKERKQGRTQGRTNDWKKAIVTLAEGEKIELFESK